MTSKQVLPIVAGLYEAGVLAFAAVTDAGYSDRQAHKKTALLWGLGQVVPV